MSENSCDCCGVIIDRNHILKELADAEYEHQLCHSCHKILELGLPMKPLNQLKLTLNIIDRNLAEKEEGS